MSEIKITLNLSRPYEEFRAANYSKIGHVTYNQYLARAQKRRREYLKSLCQEEREFLIGFFGNMDKQIELAEQQLDLLKQLRLGYEQRYLPAPEADKPLKRHPKFQEMKPSEE